MALWRGSLAQQPTALLVVAAISLALSTEVPDDDVVWKFDPQKFTVCTTNFDSHPDMALNDCKSLCLQTSGCEQFSFPIQDQKLGCRIAQKGGCQPQNAEGPGYNLYQRVQAPEDEPPDEEGPGARRRRRTDARRRTHNSRLTSATNEMNRVISEQKEKAIQIAKAAEAASVGEQEAERQHKESVAKKDVEIQKLDMSIKANIEREAAGAGKGNSGQVSAEYTQAEAQLQSVKEELSNLKRQAKVFQTNTEAAQGALEVTNAQREVVARKVEFAEQQVERLMQAPGRLADQDRMIAIAIIGKLRVARALVKGDLPAIDPEQAKVDWVANLKATMLKAVRNPSSANMEAAKAAYKTAAELKTREEANTNAAEEKEAEELQQQAQDQQIQEETAEAQQEAKAEVDKAQAEVESAVASQKAVKKATEADPTQPDPEITVKVNPPPPPPPIPVKVIPRGYYDPIDSELA